MAVVAPKGVQVITAMSKELNAQLNVAMSDCSGNIAAILGTCGQFEKVRLAYNKVGRAWAEPNSADYENLYNEALKAKKELLETIERDFSELLKLARRGSVDAKYDVVADCYGNSLK